VRIQVYNGRTEYQSGIISVMMTSCSVEDSGIPVHYLLELRHVGLTLLLSLDGVFCFAINEEKNSLNQKYFVRQRNAIPRITLISGFH
jgi:hypothetical protein